MGKFVVVAIYFLWIVGSLINITTPMFWTPEIQGNTDKLLNIISNSINGLLSVVCLEFIRKIVIKDYPWG